MCRCARWGDCSKPRLLRGSGVAVAPLGGAAAQGRACGLPRTYKGLFTLITQALNRYDMDPEERKVTQAIIPDLVVDLHALPECAQGISMENLTGGRYMADL